MVCVYCGGPTGVTNSRPQRRNNQVWRRRRCGTCGAMFSTRETAEYDLVWRIRRGKRLESFSELKLFMSLYRSCEHRKTALSDAQGLTQTVIAKLGPPARGGTLERADIARTALVALNRFDQAAAVHYQAFHQS